MDRQIIEFFASYRYGIATDLTGSHLDDVKAGLNPLLLAPKELTTQNTPRLMHTYWRCDCPTKTKFRVVIGLTRWQKLCGDNACSDCYPVDVNFGEDEVISFDQLCTLGLDVVIPEKTSEEKVKGVYWNKEKKKWVSYCLFLYYNDRSTMKLISQEMNMFEFRWSRFPVAPLGMTWRGKH